MEDIKVGEYVRTKDGYIAKLIKHGNNYGINGISFLFNDTIRDISCLIYDEDDFLFESEINHILKHSSNLIDLIEVGDFVNGYKVDFIDEHNVLVHTSRGIDKSGLSIPIVQYSDEIKTILTHEQYEQNCYKLKEES